MKINYAGYNFTHRYRYATKRPNGADSDIFIVTKKPSVLYINSCKFEVSENSVIIIKKNTPYTHESTGKYYCDDWLHFELTPEEEKKYPLPYNTVIPLKDTSILSSCIEKIYGEVYIPSLNSERKIELFFELLYLEFTEKNALTLDSVKYIDSVLHIRAFIYQYPEKRNSCTEFATRIGVSVSRLQHIYKETFGVSVLEDAIRSRIEKSKYLLKNTNYQVKEIALSLGYKNEIQFMRQFKKSTGVTALQYRKKHIEHN